MEIEKILIILDLIVLDIFLFLMIYIILEERKEKRKIEWFWFILGIGWFGFAILFYIKDKVVDWFIILSIFFGILFLFKSYFQDKMSISYWVKKKMTYSHTLKGRVS